jgi:hypothetical protein
MEIFFSIVQRKVVAPNDFTDLDQVQDRLAAFEHRYNHTTRPFQWKFTQADPEDLLTRIHRHEQEEPDHQYVQPALPPAA